MSNQNKSHENSRAQRKQLLMAVYRRFILHINGQLPTGRNVRHFDQLHMTLLTLITQSSNRSLAMSRVYRGEPLASARHHIKPDHPIK